MAAPLKTVSRIFRHEGMRHVRPYLHDVVRTVKEDNVGQTISSYVRQESPMDDTEMEAAFRKGQITVDGKPVLPNHVLRRGSVFRCRIHKHEAPVFDQPIPIVYEDEEVLAVDKPASLTVHPRGPYNRNSMLSILRDEMDIHVQLVNRLDRVTSGLVLLGRHSHAVQGMQTLFRTRTMRKTYFARVRGKFPGHASESRLAQDPPQYPSTGELVQRVVAEEAQRMSEVLASGQTLYEAELAECRKDRRFLQDEALLTFFGGHNDLTEAMEALKQTKNISPQIHMQNRIQRILNGLQHLDLECGPSHPSHFQDDLGVYFNELADDGPLDATTTAGAPDMDLGLVQCDTPDSSSMIRVDLPLAELDEVDGVPVEELEQTDDIGVYRITNSFYVPGREDLDRLLLKAVRNDAQKEFRREIESIFNQREGRVNNSGKPLRPPGAGKTIRQPWKSSATVFRRLSYDPATDTSLVACRPETGRTHQIRVHLAWLGHPIANDIKYGGIEIPESGHRFDPEDRELWRRELVECAENTQHDNRAWDYKEIQKNLNFDRNRRQLNYAQQAELSRRFAGQLGWLSQREAEELGISDALPSSRSHSAVESSSSVFETPEQRALDAEVLRNCKECRLLREGMEASHGYNSSEFHLMSIWLHAYEYCFPDAVSMQEHVDANPSGHTRFAMERVPRNMFGKTLRGRVPDWARGRLLNRG